MKRFFTHPFWPHALFWGWNSLFILFMTLGFTPLLLVELIGAVRDGWIPAGYVVLGSAMVLIPIASVAIGAGLLRKSPGRLFMFGYGVEGPLMVILAARFFAFNELTPPVMLLMVTAVTGAAALLWRLLDAKIDTRGTLPALAQLAGMTALIAVGGYVSIALAFYAPLIGAGALRLIGQALAEIGRGATYGFDRAMVSALSGLMFMVLGMTLAAFSATLFVVMPLALPLIYARNAIGAIRHAAARIGAPVTCAITGMLLTGLIATFVLLNRQPQHAAFDTLEAVSNGSLPPSSALAQQDDIRNGLLNAYLAAQRYTSAVGDVRHIHDGYRDLLSLPESSAEAIQQVYSAVYRPMLYEPVTSNISTTIEARNPWENVSLRRDSDRAAQLYAQFFDQPINKGEREAVVAAVRATWDRNRATEAWQAVDDREVFLREQALTVTEGEGWADVELYEVYENLTPRREEVVYYFSMPESAVVTGVWLGTTPDRSQRFAFTVSPRGAAQSLYRNEVRQNRDPALVEQIGPRQYRLRVFPIEPPEIRWTRAAMTPNTSIARPMHLWLTWRVLADGSGNAAGYVMPRIAEKRNVFWTSASVRTVNGAARPAGDDEWLPARVAATKPVALEARRVDFPGGQSVIATPYVSGDASAVAKDAKLALVIDRSRSMARHGAALTRAINALKQQVNDPAAVDVYLTAPPLQRDGPAHTTLAQLDPALLVFAGGQDPTDLLIQFAALTGGRTYDAVLVLTDDSGYEQADDKKAVPMPASPVWMVHLGETLPLGYADNTLTAIQGSGGGAAASVDEALLRMAAMRRATADSAIADIGGGYLWTSIATSLADKSVKAVAATDPFATFAARQHILAAIQRNKGALADIETLDQIHALAKQYNVVSPYSSMIVLVDEAQRKRLEALEKQADRFAREKEAVGETTPEDQAVVTAVPEPHEWALLITAAAMLGAYAWRRRKLAAGHTV